MPETKNPLTELVKLGRDIKADDTYRREMAQAEPAYYGIMEKHRYACPDGEGDGTLVFSNHDFEYPQELIEAVVEYLTSEEAGSDWDEAYLADHRDHEERMRDAKRAALHEGMDDDAFVDAVRESTFLASLVVDGLDLGTTQDYKHMSCLRTDALALTHEGIKQTCNLNGHNFRNGYVTYAMTAIRSPQIRTLKSSLRMLDDLMTTLTPACDACGSPMSLDGDGDNDGTLTLTFVCPECGATTTRTVALVETAR